MYKLLFLNYLFKNTKRNRKFQMVSDKKHYQQFVFKGSFTNTVGKLKIYARI